MGSFEKLVVLTVLFLVVLVVGVTLNSGEPAETGSPLDAARDRGADAAAPGAFLSQGPGSAAPAGDDPARDGAASSASGWRPRASSLGAADTDSKVGARGVEAGTQLAPQGLLVRTDGLEENPLIPDFKVYRVRPDDTWVSLSEHFYGDRRYADVLRRANDDPAALTAGESILVPTEDFGAEAGSRPRLEPRAARATGTEATEGGPATATTPDVYEVVSGDSLSVIALKVYGTSRRWEEIYQANRDVLVDPDTLDVGMKLQIP